MDILSVCDMPIAHSGCDMKYTVECAFEKNIPSEHLPLEIISDRQQLEPQEGGKLRKKVCVCV